MRSQLLTRRALILSRCISIKSATFKYTVSRQNRMEPLFIIFAIIILVIIYTVWAFFPFFLMFAVNIPILAIILLRAWAEIERRHRVIDYLVGLLLAFLLFFVFADAFQQTVLWPSTSVVLIMFLLVQVSTFFKIKERIRKQFV